MDDELQEIEMRIAGSEAPGFAGRIEAVLRPVDPKLTVRIDPKTGIVHLLTCRDTLDLVAALSGAGLDTTAMTG